MPRSPMCTAPVKDGTVHIFRMYAVPVREGPVHRFRRYAVQLFNMYTVPVLKETAPRFHYLRMDAHVQVAKWQYAKMQFAFLLYFNCSVEHLFRSCLSLFSLHGSKVFFNRNETIFVVTFIAAVHFNSRDVCSVLRIVSRTIVQPLHPIG